MHATVSLFVALSVVVVSQATPYYYPQQRQLFYPVLPQYPQYYQPQRQVYYAPQSAANLVAPVPAAVRYPVVAPPGKSVVYYGAPAVSPYPGGFVYTGGADEGAEAEGGSYWSNFIDTISAHFPAWPGSGMSEAEGGSAAEGGSSPAASPEKIEQASNSEQPAKEGEENKDKENEAEKPAQPATAQKVKIAPKGGPQKFVVVGQPQFFGNYGLQRVNPAAVLPSADHGAISSYLLLKNYPGYRFAPQFPVGPQVPQFSQGPQIPQFSQGPQGPQFVQGPQAPQAPQAADSADAELIPAGQPGAAALGYQKLLKEAAAEAARQSKEYDDSASVSVDADPQDDKPAGAEDSDGDKNEEEETGPTIAQAKPKAIALAGPGGVASASPVGTALVGPGGMAISAPEATAVAGAKGAASSGAISPATTKMASKAVRTYQLATRNLQYLLNLRR